jgi:hypothetical protein
MGGGFAPLGLIVTKTKKLSKRRNIGNYSNIAILKK